MISTKLLKCGKIAHPISIAICCTILIPVCLACHDFLLLQTAFRKGRREGMPRADATTAKALAVVLRTYSSMLSISGLIVEIIVAKPAAQRGGKKKKKKVGCLKLNLKHFPFVIKLNAYKNTHFALHLEKQIYSLWVKCSHG